MDENKLIATGLSQQQAKAYALLIESGEITPPQAAKKLRLTRTNSYKVLDKLVELELATKREKNKKYYYSLNNPSALARIVAEERNRVVEQEATLQEIIGELSAKYRQHTDQPDVTVVTGRKAVAEAYRFQIQHKKSIYFLRSTLDIASMGFDVMHSIRTQPALNKIKRYGITPDKSSKSVNESNLERTWIKNEDYTAPVEWSVSGGTLLIVIFGEEPNAITIDNPMVAEAFRQIWRIMNTCLRAMPYYSELPRKN